MSQAAPGTSAWGGGASAAPAAAAPTPTVEQIELILRQVDALPTLPAIAARVLSITNVDDADLDQLVEVIETDPSLTARVLGMCRSADKGLGDRITTVRRAVVMLGLEAVQAALLSIAVFESLRPRRPEPEGDDRDVRFDRDGFWRHSLAVASAAELIAETHVELGVKPEEAFVAGLLHDIGKLSLEVILPKAYGRVLGLAERRQCTSAEAELQLLGVDHHTAGRRLAEHWALPEPVQQVIWLCGQPVEAMAEEPHRNLLSIVWVARTLCRSLYLGRCGDYNHPEALRGPRGACKRHGFEPEAIEGLTARVHEALARRGSVLGLGEQSTPEMMLAALTAANAKLGRISAMFEQRSRAAAKQARVLSAISAFHQALGPQAGRPRGVVDTLAALVRSASGVLGPGLFGVIYQLREGESWSFYRFDEGGRPAKAASIAPPPGAGAPGQAGRPASLSSLCNPASLPVRALALLPWLTDYLSESQDLRTVNLLPLAAAGQDASTPTVVLVHDQAVGSAMDAALMEPLLSTWSAAVTFAAQQEALKRLGDRLASANRALVDAQGRLAEAEAVAKLGEFAAGAAHEMNNPLAVISGRAQLLAESASSDADRAGAAAIVDAAQRLSDLITSLRLIADPPKPRLESVAIDALVRGAIALCQERTRAAGTFRVRVPAGAPALVVDRGLLTQALAELVANAVDASPDTEVVIEAQRDAVDGRWLLAVMDRGPGMSSKALQHAFDPFFSEKPAGRRTGLGLTRARVLVEAHGGEIRLRSEGGAGTTATIAVPSGIARASAA